MTFIYINLPGELPIFFSSHLKICLALHPYTASFYSPFRVEVTWGPYKKKDKNDKSELSTHFLSWVSGENMCLILIYLVYVILYVQEVLYIYIQQLPI